jgi:Protein of unknown function (DUF2806)
VSFMFPPEAPETIQPQVENPWGSRLIGRLAEILSAPPESIGSLSTGNESHATLDFDALLNERRTRNRNAILSFASQQVFSISDVTRAVDGAWLDDFIRLSSNVSTVSEQHIWGHLLLKELAEPGAISRRTLQFLSTMDAWEIESFAEYVAFSFSFESGWRFVFDGEVARRELWSYGREIDLMQHWIDVGLLSGEASILAPKNSMGLRLRYGVKAWEMRVASDGDGNSGVPIQYRKLTATGQQISDALQLKTFNGYARNVLKALETQGKVHFELLPEEAGKVAG